MTDEEAIRQVLGRFIQLRDDKRFSEWVECFEEDGTFEYGSHHLAGRDAIREHVSDLLADDRGKHLCLSPAIRIDRDTAQVASDFVKLDPVPGGDPPRFEVVVAGRYEDRFTRREGAWRISSRTVRILGRG